LAFYSGVDKDWAMKKASWGTFLALGLGILGACRWASATPLPLNSLNLQDNPRVIYNISPVLFKQIIDHVVGTFSPMVRLHGGELQSYPNWDSPTVNALADRMGNRWILYFYGGLARRKEITPDAFSLTVCHELGHHLGGYPFKSTLPGRPPYWAASEGEADYFATHTCLSTIWEHDVQANAVHRYTVDFTAKTYCDRAYSYQVQRDLCYRIADAGEDLASLMNQLNNIRRPVQYGDVRNDVQVPETDLVHPLPQCRLETFLNGAICKRPLDLRVIPGLDIHMASGSLLDEEKDAAKFSCGDRGSVYDGSRPRCWFKPLLPDWY